MTDTQQTSLGKRLQRERDRHHWTQSQLAEKIGGSVPSINRWEHDRATPRQDMLKLLTEVFGRPPEQWGTNKPIPWNIPFLRNPHFTGREFVLQRLHQSLTIEQTVALNQPQAISGLGGIGKTQTAIEYAYRYAHEYEAILWVRADSYEALVSDFAALATVLDLQEKDEADQFRTIAAVKRWLQDNNYWLLIFDNADDLSLVLDFLPRRVGGATLLTTRSQITGSYIKKISLSKMSREEGVTFLLNYARMSSGEESDQSKILVGDEQEAAEKLWELMDGLPLALDQVASYSEATGCMLANYLLLYYNHRAALLKERGALVQDHPDPVAATWSLSFQKLEQQNPVAIELLRLCAFLYSDDIPEELLIAGVPFFGPTLGSMVGNAFQLNQAIEALRTYSLLHRDRGKQSLSLHRLVQTVLQDMLEETEKHAYIERALLMINAAFPVVGRGEWSKCERLLPHSLAIAQYIESTQNKRPEAARLLYEAGLYLRERARYTEAESFFLRSVSIWERNPSSASNNIAYSLYGLALLYREQGKYTQAEHLYQRAILAWEESSNIEHPDFTYPLNGLAYLYREQGKYEQAEHLYQRAIYVLEQAYTGEHSDIAHSLNGLAILYYDQGKYEQAEPLFQRVINIWEGIHGSEHPWVSFALNSLANLYCEEGKYEQAEPLYHRVINIWENTHGLEHHWIGFPIDGLASLYRKQGKYEQAEPLYQRALRLLESALGSECLDITYPLRGLANLYYNQGRHEQAEPLYQRVLSIRKKFLGAEHLKTARVIYDLALLREVQKNIDEAITLYEYILPIHEKALGYNNQKTREVRKHYAALLRTMGQYEKANLLEISQLET